MEKDSDERLPRIVQSGDLPLHEQSNSCLHGIIMDLKTMMMMMMMTPNNWIVSDDMFSEEMKG